MTIYKTLPSGIQIVEFEESLATTVADMWTRSAGSWGGGTAIKTAAGMLQKYTGASYFNVYVALDKGEAVGLLSLSRYYKDADTLYVHVLNVRPDYHGAKVGKALLLTAIDRTIELGYPRIDLHTWPGNTKAVPLYKKCGFFWADRSDTTLLSNFVPTVLRTELTREAMRRMDWYADSTRAIELRPDGVKENGFECYAYRWEKDGELLCVGFEHTGRRMRSIETNEYALTLTAEGHELAFGLHYTAKLHVRNKSGAPLHIEAKGKTDGVISLALDVSQTVEGEAEFSATYTLGEITEPQDAMRMHPCVLADIAVNGKHAEFGLGVEVQYPLTVSYHERQAVTQLGTHIQAHISLQSRLPARAKCAFALPENALVRFSPARFDVEIEPAGRAMVTLDVETLDYGYAALPIDYTAGLEDGRSVRFTKPLHMQRRGLSSAFSFRTDSGHGVANGAYLLNLDTNSNAATVSGPGIGAWCSFLRLGKPYDDEFNLAKPEAVRAVQSGLEMVLEADYLSQKYPLRVTSALSLSATGCVLRRFRVQNLSDQPQRVCVKDEYNFPLGYNTVLPVAGRVQKVEDGLSFGMENLDELSENWIYEEDPRHPFGVYWPEAWKPTLQWGRTLFFEHDTGTLAPGEVFQSEALCMAFTGFPDAHAFRDFALRADRREPEATVEPLEIGVNGGNPFAEPGDVAVTLCNRRSLDVRGALTAQSGGVRVSAEIAGSLPELRLPVQAGVQRYDIDLLLLGYRKNEARALFGTQGAITQSETDGRLSVSNGAISFLLDPAFSSALLSFRSRSGEWLFTQYPSKAPYAWFNPFIGGSHLFLPKMSDSQLQRESVTARFAQETDNFGNVWSGIASQVEIENFEELRGVAYEQFFLTLPGCPVLCCFARLTNRSGGYLATSVDWSTHLQAGERTETYAKLSDSQHREIRMRMGYDDQFRAVEGALVTLTSPRPEALYFYRDMTRVEGYSYVVGDNKVLECGSVSALRAKDGETVTTRPLFLIAAEPILTQEALADMGKVVFG